MQRANGYVRLAFQSKAGQSRLADLHQAGCLKAMVHQNQSNLPDAVLINTAGGLTGGDKLQAEVSVDSDASLRLSTQTAERIYQSTGDTARVQLDFKLGPSARFDWLAQETILFDAGRVQRQITVDMDDDASLLMVEPIILGRSAMGECVTTGVLHDQWRIRRAGKLIFADATRLSDFAALPAKAALGQSKALATILLVDQLAEAKKAAVLSKVDGRAVVVGASAWNGSLLFRLCAECPLKLRNTLKEIIFELRGDKLPRVWTM